MNDWNNTKETFPDQLCVQQLFEEKVKLYYNNTALIFKDQKLTYGEFNKRVNQLARRLRSEGVKPNSIVAVVFDRSFELLTALYAVIKAGGAYLPIVPSTPKERIDYLLENSKAEIVLSQNRNKFAYESDLTVFYLDELDLRSESDSDIECVNKPTDLVYVIYTSGSTGKPKGVMIEHRSLINRLLWTRKVHKFTRDDIILYKTPYTFDCSVWELFCWFIDGIKILF